MPKWDDLFPGSADQTFYAALNPDGTTRFSVPTGEIVEAHAALLDDRGRVYFGSGDGNLRALDAVTGASVWTMPADTPTTTGAFINWFEGNVAISPTGMLYVPNDNFWVYAIDRDTGTPIWHYTMPDQTWSLPAVDATSGALFIGNNNLLPILGKNTFGIAPDGTTNWSMVSLGTVAASPLLTPDGKVIVGGFDGYARAYSAADGTVLWEAATRDHIYSSPARELDGTLVQPSADGTIYDLSPIDGHVVWSFDAGTPIRSSPAIDGDGNVYVGGGDGRLYVLRADGTLRWAMKLIDDPRNDLNSSPALGANAVYIGGESGQMFSVPYDWCLRAANAQDARCTTSIAAAPDGASLAWITPFGVTLASAPTTVDANAPMTFLLAVRHGGAEQLTVLDSASIVATLDPVGDVSVDVSGDGKFLTLTPNAPLPAGPLTITLHASYLTDLSRTGLALSGGHDGGTVDATFSTTVDASTSGAIVPSATYEISRLSIPLPTLMPSYNQIGFDSLHYLLGTIALANGKGLAWMIGAKALRQPGGRRVGPGSRHAGHLPAHVVDDGRCSDVRSERRADGSDHELRASVPFVPIGDALHADGRPRRHDDAHRQRGVREHSILRSVPRAARVVQSADGRRAISRRGERRAAHRPGGAARCRHGHLRLHRQRDHGDGHWIEREHQRPSRRASRRRSDVRRARHSGLRPRHDAHIGGRRHDHRRQRPDGRHDDSVRRDGLPDDRYDRRGDGDAPLRGASSG